MPVMPAITSNWTTTSTTHSAVTGLAFPVQAGRTYKFTFWVPLSTGNTTVGAGLSVNTPGSDTYLAWTATIPSSTTANSILTSSSDSPDPGNSANLATTGTNLARVDGFIKPATTGEVQLMAETESGTLTIYAGAHVEYRDLLS